MAKTNWKKETPKKDGWYWIRYSGKHGQILCPCDVTHFQDGAVKVKTCRNDTFIDYDGTGLRWNGVPDQSIRFGPMILEP